MTSRISHEKPIPTSPHSKEVQQALGRRLCGRDGQGYQLQPLGDHRTRPEYQYRGATSAGWHATPGGKLRGLGGDPVFSRTMGRRTQSRCSIYGIFTYIYPKNSPNVGKYSIHGASGQQKWWSMGGFCWKLGCWEVGWEVVYVHP